MIGRYVRLKAKGRSPSFSFDVEDSSSVLLSYDKYDEETGEITQQVDRMSLEELVSEGKRYRRMWLAAKEIYETLKGEGFPA